MRYLTTTAIEKNVAMMFSQHFKYMKVLFDNDSKGNTGQEIRNASKSTPNWDLEKVGMKLHIKICLLNTVI